jgi:hypothetical protein
MGGRGLVGIWLWRKTSSGLSWRWERNFGRINMEKCLTSWETISYSINTLYYGRSVGRSVGWLFGWLSSGSMQRQRYMNELKNWSTIDRPLPAPAHIVNWLVWEQTQTNVVRGQAIIARPATRSLKVLQFNTHSQSVLTLTHIVYVPLLT